MLTFDLYLCRQPSVRLTPATIMYTGKSNDEAHLVVSRTDVEVEVDLWKTCGSGRVQAA